MQLLALTRQNPAVADGNSHQDKNHNMAQHVRQVHPHAATEAVAPGRKTDDALAGDDHVGASLLDTPAPRRRPPVPTQCEPTTVAYQPNGSSHHVKPPLAQSGEQFDVTVLCA